MKHFIFFISFCFFISGMSVPAVFAQTYNLYDPATGLDIRIDGDIDRSTSSLHFLGTIQSDITWDLICDIVLQWEAVSGSCTNDMMGTFQINQAPESVSSVIKEGLKHAVLVDTKPVLSSGLLVEQETLFLCVTKDQTSAEPSQYEFAPLLRRPRWG